jgi:hypothetical protein
MLFKCLNLKEIFNLVMFFALRDEKDNEGAYLVGMCVCMGWFRLA